MEIGKKREKSKEERKKEEKRQRGRKPGKEEEKRNIERSNGSIKEWMIRNKVTNKQKKTSKQKKKEGRNCMSEGGGGRIVTMEDKNWNFRRKVTPEVSI